jgi:pyridoxal phosphate enzyme (YggS family)
VCNCSSPLCLNRSVSIAGNIVRVLERIDKAAARAGRVREEIALMAVSKTVEPERIREAYGAGIRLFGENRVQEFAGKAEAVRELDDAEWHLIGHLQSNKAAHAAELFAGVDSLDSLKLAEKLHASAAKLGRKLPVLIEINIGGEPGKTGVATESEELGRILGAASRLEYLEIRGLMTVPPFTADPQGARPFFRNLRTLRDEIAARRLPGIGMETLSIGMSHDFEIAIEEGSTCVRLGTAIFGERAGKMQS